MKYFALILLLFVTSCATTQEKIEDPGDCMMYYSPHDLRFYNGCDDKNLDTEKQDDL